MSSGHHHRLRGLFPRRYITIPVLFICCITISCGLWLLPMFNVYDLFYPKRQRVWKSERFDKIHTIAQSKLNIQLNRVFEPLNRTTIKPSQLETSKTMMKDFTIPPTRSKGYTLGRKEHPNLPRLRASLITEAPNNVAEFLKTVTHTLAEFRKGAPKNTGKLQRAVPNTKAKFERASAKSLTAARTGQADLCVLRFGRLGNRMFQFAALLAVAREKNMAPFVETSNELLNVFQLKNITIKPSGICETLPTLEDKRVCAYDKVIFNPSDYRALALKGYFQSWRYFDDIIDEIRRQFVFKPLLKALARNALQKALYLRQNSTSVDRNTVVVGVHIRRDDILRWDRVEFGNVVATKDYLYHATDYFREKYRKVLFVASSDDIPWTKSTLTREDTVYLEGNSPEVDFASLCLCNHTIMTVGTFGWWSAWLANGTTIYYRHQYAKYSNLASFTNMTDYIPRGWIPMD